MDASSAFQDTLPLHSDAPMLLDQLEADRPAARTCAPWSNLSGWLGQSPNDPKDRKIERLPDLCSDLGGLRVRVSLSGTNPFVEGC